MTWAKGLFKLTKWLVISLSLIIVLSIAISISGNEYSMWRMNRALETFVTQENLRVSSEDSQLIAGPLLSCDIATVAVINIAAEGTDSVIERFLLLNQIDKNTPQVPVPEFYVWRDPDSMHLHANTETDFNFDPRCFGFERQYPNPNLDVPVAEFFGPWKTLWR